MAIKYTNIFYYKAVPNIPKSGFLVSKPSGNPASNASLLTEYSTSVRGGKNLYFIKSLAVSESTRAGSGNRFDRRNFENKTIKKFPTAETVRKLPFVESYFGDWRRPIADRASAVGLSVGHPGHGNGGDEGGTDRRFLGR
jgi:hypothetical protein